VYGTGEGGQSRSAPWITANIVAIHTGYDDARYFQSRLYCGVQVENELASAASQKI
jgi:hypothetical protein